MGIATAQAVNTKVTLTLGADNGIESMIDIIRNDTLLGEKDAERR